MSTRQRITVLSMLACLAASFPAREAHAKRRVELGLFGGLHLFSDANAIGRTSDLVPGLEHSGILGIRMAFGLTGRLDLEAEFGVLPSNIDDDRVTALAWRAHFLFHFMKEGSQFRPFLAAGGGMLTTSVSDESPIETDADTAFHGGAGVKWAAGRKWGMRLDARLLFPPATNGDGRTDDWEVTLGVYGTFEAGVRRRRVPIVDPDPDKDGLKGIADACPVEAEDEDKFKDDDGCPEADNDADGVLDATDACPLEAGPPGSANGCPPPPPPVPVPNDRDGDGVVDEEDQCADDPEDRDGFQDDDGCIDRDNDADGVEDAEDRCANELETSNGYEDGDGCPDEIPEEIKKFTGTIAGITFESGSATITTTSYAVLDTSAALLTTYPTLRLEISGHTDSKGKATKNVILSQQRAESVKAYLVAKGIDPARLETVGYGPGKPVADNKTAAGRAQNRRIEFRLLSN